MDKNQFFINTNNIHIANAEEDISKTIEQLLDLNKLIPKRTNKEIDHLTEKQLEKDPYINKKSIGEVGKVTELQFDNDGKSMDYPFIRNDGDIMEVQEIQIEDAKPEDNGNNSKTYDIDGKSKIRGHKEGLIPPIWKRVYEQEDGRKGNKDEKKITKKTASLNEISSNDSHTEIIDLNFINNGIRDIKNNYGGNYVKDIKNCVLKMYKFLNENDMYLDNEGTILDHFIEHYNIDDTEHYYHVNKGKKQRTYDGDLLNAKGENLNIRWFFSIYAHSIEKFELNTYIS